MSNQTDFNDKVLDLLNAIVEKVEPCGRRSEPKHEIIGNRLHDLLWEVLIAKPESF